MRYLKEPGRRIVVLAGAGISVSAGIPDFRSENGLYNVIDCESLGLSQPEELFDIHFFKHDPKPFFSYARALYPGKIRPTTTHRFFRLLEKKRKLRRLYTQNIDGLEHVAGMKKVVYCHGSFVNATCLDCRKRVRCEDIREDVMEGKVPRCERCEGVVKPDITFFGEKLKSKVRTSIRRDVDKADLIIVVGTSLKVAPMSRILSWFPSHVPRVLCNRERVNGDFDLELLGNCDDVFSNVARKLGWDAELTREDAAGRSTTTPSS